MVLHRKWLDKYLNGVELDYSSGGQWHKFTKITNLNIFNERIFSFRDSIKYININGFEVPEPLKLHPDVGEKYYGVHISDTELFGEWTWVGDNLDSRWLTRGLCHSTKEAAILHAQALLSFTRG